MLAEYLVKIYRGCPMIHEEMILFLTCIKLHVCRSQTTRQHFGKIVPQLKCGSSVLEPATPQGLLCDPEGLPYYSDGQYPWGNCLAWCLCGWSSLCEHTRFCWSSAKTNTSQWLNSWRKPSSQLYHSIPKQLGSSIGTVDVFFFFLN